MIFIGCHLSISDGYEAMGEAMTELGGNTFAFFTRNPRGGKMKDIDPEDVARLWGYLQSHSFGPLVAHAPYTMNLCSENERVREYAEECFSQDLLKMELLPGNYFNFHPGNFQKQDKESCIKRIADVINRYVTDKCHTTVLLETMAGKGTEIGRTFEELAQILSYVRPDIQDKVGICLDTCHVWDAGYDLVNHPDQMLEEFDRIIGLDRLKAVHLNDSLNDCGSHKDRHAKLGQGMIGLVALRNIAQHTAFQGKPFILETPNDAEGYKKEIALVRSWE